MSSRWNVNTIAHCIGIFILWMSCTNSVNCHFWTSNTYQDLTRTTRQINCKTGEYKCRNGACIRDALECDGKPDCADGSDETPDCKKVFCLVPKVPANGKFIEATFPKHSYKEGDYISNLNTLVTNCDKQYRLSPPNVTFPICVNGVWTSPPLQCARYCKSLINTKSTKYSCRLDNRPLSSCVEPVEGTIAESKCEIFYEGPWTSRTRICQYGTWDYPIYECLPVCGQKRPKVQQFIISGVEAAHGDYPWHVGIYRNDANKTYICGGSIINQAVIISAAHCFTDSDGNLFPKENYLIAAGKYYNLYDDKRDQFAQYSTIKKIYKPERYRGKFGNYEADIAIVVLTKPFSISIDVQAVCMDWDTSFEHDQLIEHSLGVVVGWGSTEKGAEPSMELKQLETPYIPYDQCFDQVPKDFRKFLAHDKICAGYLPKSRSVCEGDGGGGLTFSKKTDGRYYLRGVVSVLPRSDESCDSNHYATYTLISKYIDFIKDIEVLNRI